MGNVYRQAPSTETLTLDAVPDRSGCGTVLFLGLFVLGCVLYRIPGSGPVWLALVASVSFLIALAWVRRYRLTLYATKLVVELHRLWLPWSTRTFPLRAIVGVRTDGPPGMKGRGLYIRTEHGQDCVALIDDPGLEAFVEAVRARAGTTEVVATDEDRARS